MPDKKKYCINCFLILPWETAECTRCHYPQFEEESPLYLRPPFRLNEQYYIGRVLGHGGFAITYLGYDRNLGMAVAIKEYFPIEFANRDTDGISVAPFLGTATERFNAGKEKFISEARLLANFRSPNIIKIRQFFKALNTAYFVMEYLEGDTLTEYIRNRGGKLPFAEVKALLMPLLDALEEVHQKGIYHRDIKPDNIYMTLQKEPILLDFGAARQALSGQTTHLLAFLTPGFAPAEQYSINGIQGPWTDIYSLAATLYYALTGILPPVPGDRLLGDAELILPSQLGIDISPQDEEWLLKGLEIRWSNRPDSIQNWRNMINRSNQIVLNDPESQTRTAEENFTKSAILPRLTRQYLTPKDEEAILASAAFMEISLDRVKLLIEAALQVTGAQRIDDDPDDFQFEELQRKEEELKRKEEELKRFEELRSKEEELWWEAELAERDAEKKRLEQEQALIRAAEEKQVLEKQEMEAEIQRKQAELKRFEELRSKEEELWWEAELAERDAEKKRLEAEQSKLREAELKQQLEKERMEAELHKREEELKQREEELRKLEERLNALKAEPLEQQPLEAKPDPLGRQIQQGLTQDALEDLEEISEEELNLEKILETLPEKKEPKVSFESSSDLMGLDAHYARLASEISEIPESHHRLFSAHAASYPSRLTNSLGMEFALIHPYQGSDSYSGSQVFRVGPQENGFSELARKPFYLQTTPVTQRQWQFLMYNQPAQFQDPMAPVEQVSWDDCQLFIHRLNQFQEANYRLPSEVEWEYACRAGNLTRYFYGDDPANLEQYAWFAGNSHQTTHPVGLKRPNPLGLFDILGNVREWVQDRYQPLPGQPPPSEDGKQRVVRSGAFDTPAEGCTCRLRVGLSAVRRLPNLGFRLLIEIA